MPDRQTFAAYFAEGAEAASFANLGGDATLVVPAPRDAFWQAVAATALEHSRRATALARHGR